MRHDLLSEVENFLRRTKIAESRFGREVSNSPRLVKDMRELGRRLGDSLAGRTRAFMESYRD